MLLLLYLEGRGRPRGCLTVKMRRLMGICSLLLVLVLIRRLPSKLVELGRGKGCALG